MTRSVALPCASQTEAVREAAAAQVVPLLRASLDVASDGPGGINDSPAGRIIVEVLFRDADAESFEGTAHLAAGVALVLSWLVAALGVRTEAGDAEGLAGELAAQCRLGGAGEHVADVLDHLLDGTVGARVLRRLLADDQEALLEVVLGLAEVAAVQARALARTDDTDMEAIWTQIEEGLRDHP